VKGFRERNLVLTLAGILTVVLILIGLCTRFVAIPWTVDGDSMEPTLRSGDRVLVDLWTYRNRPPEQGDVVLIRGPGSVRMVKRISPTGSPPGFVYVLGDNYENSQDSRKFGPIPREAVLGRVLLRYWPLSEAGPIL